MLMYEELSHEILAACIEVHRELGPGLLESAYEECLCREFGLRSIAFRRQDPLPVTYKGIRLDCGYRMDIVADDKILLEIKSVEAVHALHEAQLMTYLRLSGLRVGLLINFNVTVLKDGVVRRVR